MRTTYRLLTLIVLSFLISSISVASSYRDATGKLLTISSSPKRIISLAPNITEILYAIGAEEQLVGVTDWCKYPSKAQTKTIVGGFINPNLEVIAHLKPDLIIMTADSNQGKVYDQLVQLKFRVFVVNPRNLNQTLETIRQLGNITGHAANSDRLAQGLQNRINKVESRVAKSSKPRVLFLWSINPMISCGRNTFTDDLISRSGGINVMGNTKTNYPQINYEQIIRLNPDIIISAAMGSEIGQRIPTSFKRLKDVSAIKNNRYYTINPDDIARPAPSIVTGFETISMIIHPINKKVQK